MEKKYVISFFISSISLGLIILGFITWMNPDRTIYTPWGIDLITDRNMTYRKFHLLKDKTDYTDLIVGSSTSETLIPKVIEELQGVKAQQVGTGGAKTPFRLAEINYAIKNNPNLKRIIYFVDLFEFVNTDLDANTFSQKEIMSQIDSDLRKKLTTPSIPSRMEHYFSEPVLKSAFQTLLDYKKSLKDQYKSSINPDGTTSNSMVVVNRKEAIEPRVMRIAHSYEGLYKNINALDALTIEFFHRIIENANAHNVEVVFIITPWHTLFYKHFEADLKRHNDVYAKWVEFMNGLKSNDVKVVDYSYPLSLKKGIPDDAEYWGDGIHFGLESAKIILKEIYSGR